MYRIVWKLRHFTNKIILHDSHTPPSVIDGMDYLKSKGRDMGLMDIGYHYLIPREGIPIMCRDVERIGSHTPGHNMDSIGICLIGGIGDDGRHGDNFTVSQRIELFSLLAILEQRWPGARIVAHTELQHYADRKHQCPAVDMEELRHQFAIFKEHGVVL